MRISEALRNLLSKTRELLNTVRGDSDLGSAGEALAERYLRGLGFRILHRRYQDSGGEIDLICSDRGQIVFVEVKTRRDDHYGEPWQAVNRDKQQRISRVAARWLKRNRQTRSPRFDVISIVWSADRDPKIQHFRNAFDSTE